MTPAVLCPQTAVGSLSLEIWLLLLGSFIFTGFRSWVVFNMMTHMTHLPAGAGSSWGHRAERGARGDIQGFTLVHVFFRMALDL